MFKSSIIRHLKINKNQHYYKITFMLRTDKTNEQPKAIFLGNKKGDEKNE